MLSKPLRLLLILGSGLSLAVVGGCLTGTGSSAGGGAARSIFDAGAAGPGASSFAGPSSPSGDSGDNGSGNGAEAGDAGTTSDSPITVVGSPLGTSQGPHCAESGTRLFFDDVSLAITGQTDELGRREILVRSGVHTQLGSAAPEGFGGSVVLFVNPDEPDQSYGNTAPQSGCLFAKLYAPPEAAGKIVRMTVSMGVCAPADPIGSVDHQEASSIAALSFGPFGGSSSATAVLDFPIPAQTDESTLVDCGPTTKPGDVIRGEYLNDAVMEKRIEKYQQNESDSPQTLPFGRESITHSRF